MAVKGRSRKSDIPEDNLYDTIFAILFLYSITDTDTYLKHLIDIEDTPASIFRFLIKQLDIFQHGIFNLNQKFPLSNISISRNIQEELKFVYKTLCII